MIRIAVVDDEKEMLDYLYKCISESTKKYLNECEIQCFDSSFDFLSKHNLLPFQILFADICMPEMDGFELSKQLRTEDQQLFIIYVTANDYLVFQSFDYQPFQFIRKRDNKSIKVDIDSAIQKVCRHLNQNQIITLDMPYNEKLTVNIHDIEYIISDKHYLEYYFRDGTSVKCRETISEAEKKMRKYDFIRIHRSYLINLKYVIKLSTSQKQVRMKSGKQLEMGEMYVKSLEDKYRKFLRSMI